MTRIRIRDDFDGIFSHEHFNQLLALILSEKGPNHWLFGQTGRILACRGLTLERSPNGSSRLRIQSLQIVTSEGRIASGDSLVVDLPDAPVVVYARIHNVTEAIGDPSSPLLLETDSLLLIVSPREASLPDGIPVCRVEVHQGRSEIDSAWWPNCVWIGSDERGLAAANDLVEAFQGDMPELIAMRSDFPTLSWNSWLSTLIGGLRQEKRNLAGVAVLLRDAAVATPPEACTLLKSLATNQLPAVLSGSTLREVVTPRAMRLENGVRVYNFNCTPDHGHVEVGVLVKTGDGASSVAVLKGTGAADVAYEQPVLDGVAKIVGTTSGTSFALSLTRGELVGAGLYSKR